MTPEKYYLMCEQMGKTPEQDEIPPSFHDFPADVQKALIVFNKLTDKIQANVGYLGKDYTPVPLYIEVHEVENKEIFLEALRLLDARIIQRSAREVKAAHEKSKRGQK